MGLPVLVVSPGDLRRILFWLNSSHTWDVDVEKGAVYVPGVGWIAMSVLQTIKLGTLVVVSSDCDEGSEYGG